MPGMGGWGIAAAVKERRPGTPVGLVTGWVDTVDATAAAGRGVDFVLAKPVERAHSRAALAGLGAAAGPRQWSPPATSSILDGDAERPTRGTTQWQRRSGASGSSI
jgi:DNA-binding response OmpR family regulator